MAADRLEIVQDTGVIGNHPLLAVKAAQGKTGNEGEFGFGFQVSHTWFVWFLWYAEMGLDR